MSGNRDQTMCIVFRKEPSMNPDKVSTWAGTLLAGALCIPLSPFALLAEERQEPEEVLDIQPVTVSGQKIENIEDVKRNLAKRPGSVVLVPEKEIKESRGLNLNDVLQFAPGVRFQSRFGADEGQFQIRGTALRSNFHHRGTNILINGIFFGDADGFSDFESIDLMAYERIEVYKGANALRYGANSIGGAINFVPRTGYNASRAQVRGMGGSYGLYMGQMSSGTVTGPFQVGGTPATGDYYISFSGNHQDGFQDGSQQSRLRLNANFGLQIGNHQEIRAYLLSADVNERIPGSLTNEQLFEDRKQVGGQNPTGTNTFFACTTSNAACKYGRYYQLQRLGVAYRNEFALGQFFEFIPYFQYQYLDHPIFQTIRQNNFNLGGELRYGNTSRLFGHENAFIVGNQTRYTNMHQRRFEQLGGVILREAQNAHLDSSFVGIYAEDQFGLSERLNLVLGLRWDYSIREANIQAFSPFPPAVPFCPNAATDPTCPVGLFGQQESLRHFNAVLPKLGFVYRVAPQIQVYGNASRGYEPPLMLELTAPAFPDGTQNVDGFLDLDAQRAWQFELGTRGASANGRYTWDLTLFDLEMEKEILAANIFVPASNSIQGTFMNANSTRHSGVEAGGAAVLTRGLFARAAEGGDDSLQARVAYTWSRLRFTDDVLGNTTAGPDTLIAKEGNVLPGIPEHDLHIEVRYDHPAGWWVAPNVEWAIAGYYVDYLNTVKNPAYFVLHLKAGYEPTKNLTFYVEGRNLTDKTYAGAVVVNDALNRFANPAAGVSGFAGAEWRY